MQAALGKPRYNAFISYSHEADKELARKVQRSLGRLTKPWYKPRALTVYRDESTMGANSALWTTIQAALAESEFLILFASPGAALSPWVRREVAWWLANRSKDRLLIVLTAGEIAWDAAAGDYDWTCTSALPEALKGVYTEPAFHIDLRWAASVRRLSLKDPAFQDAVASLAAPLHRKSKDRLVGEELRQQRRAVRAAVIASLAILLLGSASGKLFWDLRDQQQQAVALNKLNGIRADLIRAIEWRRQPSRDAKTVRAALAKLLERLSEHSAAHPEQIQAHYVKAGAHFYLGQLEAAEESLRRSLALDQTFAPGWTMLARVQFEQFKRTRYVSDDSQYAVKLLGGVETTISVQTITRETIRKEKEHDPLLQQALEALERAAAGVQESMAVEKWGLERTPEDDVNDILIAAMRRNYLERDFDAALATLERAHRAAPSEDYCLLLGWWSTESAARLKWFDEAVFRAPLYPAARLDRGNERHQQGDLDGAIDDASLALEMDPQLLPAYVNRGNALYKRGDRKSAVADFNRAIELAPSLPYAHYARAVSRAQEDRAGAISDLDRAISLHPGLVHAYYVRGSLRLLDGAYDAAIEDLTAAINGARGAFADAFYARARCYSAKGDIERAMRDLNSALSVSPGLAQAQYFRGTLRRKRGDVRGAFEDFSAAVKNDPRLAQAYEERGGILYESGDTAAALRDFEKAIALRPSPIAYNNRGLVHQTRGNVDAAISDYRKAIALKPDFALAYYNLGNAWIDKNDTSKAVEAYTRTVTLNPKYAAAYHNRGKVYELRGDSTAAISDYTQAIKADPSYMPAYRSRGTMLGSIGKLDAAVEDFTRALQFSPNDPSLYLDRGLTWHMADDFKRAITDYNAALSLDPKHAKGYMQRAKARAALREYRSALDDVESALYYGKSDERLRADAMRLVDFINRRASEPTR